MIILTDLWNTCTFCTLISFGVRFDVVTVLDVKSGQMTVVPSLLSPSSHSSNLAM